MKVEVVSYDRGWRDAFADEARIISSALGGGDINVDDDIARTNIKRIHHIGSTAIPGIYAKPVIDFLVEVRSLVKVDACNSAMEVVGYEVMGEFGIPDRRYFRKENPPGIRTHNVHVFLAGSAEVIRHLAFRDYLIAHTDEAQRYSVLKCQLAEQYPNNIEAYMDGKDALVKALEQRALSWWRQRAD